MKKIFCFSLMSVILGTQLLSGATVFANAPSTSAVKVVSNRNLANTEIQLKGVVSDREIPSFKIKFDVSNENDKKIKITDMVKYGSYGIHAGFYDSKYIEIGLYRQDGTKEIVTLKGTSKPEDVNVLNGQSFEYGDYIRIEHVERWRYSLNDTLGDAMGIEGNEFSYRITKDGLQPVSKK